MMSECGNRGNACPYNDDDEISLSELFGHIFNHFRLILVIILVFTLVGVCYAVLKPDEYKVYAVVKIQEPYGSEEVKKFGGESITATQVLYDIFSRPNMENAIANTPSEKKVYFEDVEENLLYVNIKETDNYSIYIKKTHDISYWIEFINNLVSPVMTSASSTYLSEANKALETVKDSILSYEELLSSANDTERQNLQTTINNLKIEKKAIETYISALPQAFEWVIEPSSSTKCVGTSKTLICIVFLLAGVVVGVVAALIIGFNDKRIYSSIVLKEKMNGRLVASVPLYKKGTDLDRREFEYIAEKLPLNKDDKLSIVSLSPKAGKKTIEKGLKCETEAEVRNLGNITEKPEILSEVRASSYTLVVLRAGFDALPRVDKLVDDFREIGVENYGFVLNGVDKSDKDVILYSGKESYAKHIWLLETWKGYYRKNN